LEDILFLFGHFTKQLSKHYGLDPPTFSDGFIDALLNHDWPGNVRQLENFTERLVLARPRRALAARDFERLRSASLADADQQVGITSRPAVATTVDTSKSLEANLAPAVEQLEQDYLRSVLRQNSGRVAAAARQAGISRRTLLRKMRLHGIDKREFKG
jgi:DNA-binding NtrC family response regulator